jgi:hypothetical protein
MYEPMIKPSLQIMEATNSMPAHEFVGAQSSMDINDPQSNNDGFSTPRKTTSFPSCGAMDTTMGVYASGGPAGYYGYWMQPSAQSHAGLLFPGYWMASY